MILFIGNYTDNETYKLITENGVRDLSQASRLFQERFILQLSRVCPDFKAISIIPSRSDLSIPDSIYLENIQLQTVCLDQSKLSQYKEAMNRVTEIVLGCIGKYGHVNVVMYAINPIALLPLFKQRKRYDIEITTICPELPEFRRYRKTVKNEIKRNIFRILNRCFDKYILFSESMSEYIPSKKKWIVLEGFAPEISCNVIRSKKNIAMYAGGLATDNGIQLMIEAANRLDTLDELWICGVGDCQNMVEKSVNEKIRYFGRVDNKTVVNMENQATVLLNLRNPSDPLTQFSFPSKIMEYMASGSLVLSTKLMGISKEYYDYIHTLEDYTVDGVCQILNKMFSISEEEYTAQCTKALEFIETKRASNRMREVLSFLEERQ